MEYNEQLCFHNDLISLVFFSHNTGDAYNTDERTVVAGYDNGDIKMFDLKKMAIRWETNIKNGVHEILLLIILQYYF